MLLTWYHVYRYDVPLKYLNLSLWFFYIMNRSLLLFLNHLSSFFLKDTAFGHISYLTDEPVVHNSLSGDAPNAYIEVPFFIIFDSYH